MTHNIRPITVDTLPVVTYQNVRVITTDLLAQLYGADPESIRNNFLRNQPRFTSGKHYFKLEGENLRQFKELHKPSFRGAVEISPRARHLTLWTERGAARHAKMLDTDAAWEVFEQLENAYFNPREASPASQITDPTLAALVQTAIEVSALKQQQSRINHKTEILETRLQNVELQHRKNVPEGYLAKKHAHHLYGEGLSEEIFHLAMAKLGVPIKNYIHINEDGFESPTYAYLESEIAPAVQTFLDDAEQCAPQTCRSPMLSNKRFRYVKETVTLQ